MKIVNTANAEHYKWGLNSDGWHLLKTTGLSVIEENVPSNEQEVRHYHQQAQQFFYILEGTAHIEISGTEFVIEAGNGIHVPAMKPHQLSNKSDQVLRFIVVSQPHSHGDRVRA